MQIFVYLKYFILYLFLCVFLLEFPSYFFYKILFIPIFNILYIICSNSIKNIKNLMIINSICLLNYVLLILFVSIDINNKHLYQFILIKLNILNTYNKYFNIFMCLDYLSLIFIILTCFLFSIVFLSLYTYSDKNIKIFFILLNFLLICILNVFIQFNLFWFFFFFETSVFPMYLIILLGGSRFQKIKASYYFFFFTILGSILLFISINYLIIEFNTVNLYKLYFYIEDLSIIEQQLLWLSFFLSFAVKIPMFPFHTWLPEAHVEAPTAGSILLAGILLKLGCYGFIRINLILFPLANLYYSPYIYILCILSIFYSCLIACRQTDFKRIIAYASIAHMNLIVLGIFSFNPLGIYGAIFQSVSHGLVSSGLFYLVGVLYTRYKSRIIQYYSGLSQVMPLFSSFFLVYIFANISFPFTSNFIGELLLFLGISSVSFLLVFICLISILLNTIYSLWFCNRIIYGNLKSQLIYIYKDLNHLEIFILSILLSLIIFLGIFPNCLNIGNLSIYLKLITYLNL